MAALWEEQGGRVWVLGGERARSKRKDLTRNCPPLPPSVADLLDFKVVQLPNITIVYINSLDEVDLPGEVLDNSSKLSAPLFSARKREERKYTR